MHRMIEAIRTEFPHHDPLVQALALHYRIAAMHPFLDGNGRTARAMEALMLQRVGLRDTLFIAMSNYYYEQKTAYLQALNEARAGRHDLTPFLRFALRGIEVQCNSLFAEINRHVKKALYRNTVSDLFGRLRSPRKRVMNARHVQVLILLLEEEELTMAALGERARSLYALKNPRKAFTRDLAYLESLGAISIAGVEDARDTREVRLRAKLEWPMEITETEFFRRVKQFPKGKTYSFLSS
jgi:Fic family protein